WSSPPTTPEPRRRRMAATGRRTTAIVAAALLGALALGVGGVAATNRTAPDPARRIRHIVVVYEENHSFDNLWNGWPALAAPGRHPRRRRRPRRLHPGPRPQVLPGAVPAPRWCPRPLRDRQRRRRPDRRPLPHHRPAALPLPPDAGRPPPAGGRPLLPGGL